MKFDWLPANKSPAFEAVGSADWSSWQWQLQNSLKSVADFQIVFSLTQEELNGFANSEGIFKIRVTPYYASLAGRFETDAIRRIFMPRGQEGKIQGQSLLDPLAERENNPVPRIIHRYPDRVLFLITDVCSVYCRFCTRKHFTGKDHSMIPGDELSQALQYIRAHPGIREVILSGGDPLTLGDRHLESILQKIREIEHIEIIRIGTRIPVVCPMRINASLVEILRKYQPIYLMNHFNHPRELTLEAANGLRLLADAGVPLMNQMVLLNGVNNHPSLVQALNRRLLFLRVKPYYMFQCDPSQGTEHLRTSIEESESIQRALWGNLSGLALPPLSLDVPDGGGKVGLVPQFEIHRDLGSRTYRGFDGKVATYLNPDKSLYVQPADWQDYQLEWDQLRLAKQDTQSSDSDLLETRVLDDKFLDGLISE